MQDPYDLIIRNAEIVNADGRMKGDIAITGGRIAQVGEVTGTANEVVDAGGKLVLPGGVDPHCHIEQMSGMGQMNADTFETATRSAALGGTTSLISFAAQAKGQQLREALGDYAARAARGAMVDHAFHLSISDCSVPDFERDLGELIDAGHRSIKVFTTYNIRLGDADILDVMTTARRHGALVCVHAENDALINWTRNRLIAQGKHAPTFHAPSHPRLAEIEAVERMCRFAEYLGQPMMLFHISTSEAVDALKRAQQRGVPVVAETCPHYLTMGPEVLEAPGIEGAKWMCSPPQRGESDRQALWQALDEDVLQLVSSDHAPYRFDETGKLSAGSGARFDQIANGMPGLETRLPVLFDAIVSKGRGSLESFVRLTSTAPAQIYGLTRKGRIAPGYDADLVIWDDKRRYRYGENDLGDNVGYNPYVGYEITGMPEQVFLRGKLLVKDGMFNGEQGQGAWLKRDQIGVADTTPAPEAQLVLNEG